MMIIFPELKAVIMFSVFSHWLKRVSFAMVVSAELWRGTSLSKAQRQHTSNRNVCLRLHMERWDQAWTRIPSARRMQERESLDIKGRNQTPLHIYIPEVWWCTQVSRHSGHLLQPRNCWLGPSLPLSWFNWKWSLEIWLCWLANRKLVSLPGSGGRNLGAIDSYLEDCPDIRCNTLSVYLDSPASLQIPSTV